MKPKTLLIAAALALVANTAGAETDLMGEARQWSVAFVHEKLPAYCRLSWDSALGTTVEFRESLDDIVWVVSRNGWSIPEGTTTTVSVIGQKNTISVPAEYFDPNSLRLWNVSAKKNRGGIQAVIRNALNGSPDLELDFQGDEPNLTVPLSRAWQLQSTFDACIKRLSSTAYEKVAGPTTTPF